MRMSRPSARRQPCRAFSCMEETRNLPSGLKAAATCEPAQRIITGFCSAIRAHHRATPP